MNPKVESLLLDLKQILEQKKLDSIGMFYFRMRHKEIKQKDWKYRIRELVRNNKIEIFGETQQLRPI